jgi:hypothetical protein
MSDTPETDSLLEGEGTQCSVNIVKLLNLCRKFERERNEAVAAINDCVNWANGKEDEWGTRAENSFNFLHRFLAKCKTDQPKP